MGRPPARCREGSCILPPDQLSGSTLPGSFNPMGWSLAQAAHYTLEIISMHWATWLLILPVLGICLWYLVRQALYSILRSRSPQPFSPHSARRYSGVFFRKYFLIPLLFSLPVYFTAYDYGRWFTVTCINFVMLAVSVNLPCLRVRASQAGCRRRIHRRPLRRRTWIIAWSFMAFRSSFASWRWFCGCPIIAFSVAPSSAARSCSFPTPILSTRAMFTGGAACKT